MGITKVLATSAVVLALAGGPAMAETVLKLGHVSSADNVYHKGALRFAERVKELTGGSVTVDALCCAQLGNDVAQAKTVQLGAQDLAIVSSNNLAQFDPRIDIFSLPALFQDIPSAQKAVFGPVGDEIFENFRQATGMRVVYTTAWGSRSLINNRNSIRKPGDMEGLLIRSPGSSEAVAVFYTLDGTATGGGVDYDTIFRELVVFGENEYERCIEITIHSDALVEGDEE